MSSSSALNARKAAIVIGGISAAIFCASAFVFRWYSSNAASSNKRRLLRKKSTSTAAVDNNSSSSGGSSNKTAVPQPPRPCSDVDDLSPQKTVENDPQQQSSIFKADDLVSTISSEVADGEEKMSSTVVVAATATVVSSSPSSPCSSSRGGRRDYRQHHHHRRSAARDEQQPAAAVYNPPSSSSSYNNDQEPPPPAANNIFNDPAIVEISPPPTNTNAVSSAAEIRGAELAAQFEAKCQVVVAMTATAADSLSGSPASSESGEETTTTTMVCNNQQMQHQYQQPVVASSAYHHHYQHQQQQNNDGTCGVKMPCVESPSLSSDVQSEASHDSGKGGSTGLLSSMSPVEELIEIPAVYEFEVPQDIVGLLIGKHGITIKWLSEQSQAHIVIRQHFYSDRHKICTLEGTREQINMCLRYIRRKFPPSRFPDLKLTPIIPPPPPVAAHTAPHTPVWDNVIQLNLPEGVSCEVVISSVVDAGHFFLQQPTHPSYPSLARLDQYMMAVYGQSIGVPPLPRPVDAGIICAAPVLGGWYRAQTMEVYDDADQVLVKFVDYGGYAKVAVNDLRQIRSDFMTLPFQSAECYLAHVKPDNNNESGGGGGWTVEATAAFEQLTQGKVLEASVLGHARDNVPVVELFVLPTAANEHDDDDTQTVSVSRLLSSGGHAVWSD